MAAGERLLCGSFGFRHDSRSSQLLFSASAGAGAAIFTGCCVVRAGDEMRELIGPLAIDSGRG
jgi:hypothetical protein